METLNNPNAHIRIENFNVPVSVSNNTNHNEVALLQRDWQKIKTLSNRIEIKKYYGIKEAIIGAFLLCFIDVICKLINGIEANFLPIIIVLGLYMLYSFMEGKIEFFSPNNNERNSIYLGELNDLINVIENDRNKDT